MGVVNRTDEFQRILEGLVAQGEYRLNNVDTLKPQEQSQVNVWSGEIGKEIHQTSLNVQELRRKMAKSKGIFNTRSSEIDELICRVKEDIRGLTTKIDFFERQMAGKGPNRSMKLHSSNVVGTLRIRFHEVTQDFKEALIKRTKIIETQHERRQEYTGGHSFSQPQLPAPSANPDDPEDSTRATAQVPIYDSSRARAVESIQRTIGELATMMRNVGEMVSAQGELIERVDKESDDIRQNVDDAQENLLRFYQRIASDRSLIMKVFMILIFFVVVFIVFLA